MDGLPSLLDAVDGDPDIETDDDEGEPNFGPPGGEECILTKRASRRLALRSQSINCGLWKGLPHTGPYATAVRTAKRSTMAASRR